MSEPTVVLVSEDNPSFRKFLKYFFLNKGFQVITASSPERTLETLHENPKIEAAYLDVYYKNSRMTGFEIAAQLQKLKGTDFPFIVMSTDDSYTNQQNSEKLGAIAFIDKNYESIKTSVEYLKKYLEDPEADPPY